MSIFWGQVYESVLSHHVVLFFFFFFYSEWKCLMLEYWSKIPFTVPPITTEPGASLA